MSFLSVLALAVVLLVAAPIAAHLLRRKQAEEQPFPAARLVPATPPAARRRSMLEDRALFAVRALAVLTLAVLGATPFVRCQRLAIARKEGASVALAIVLDDSLSMRAAAGGEPAAPGRTTRFDRALKAARELTQGMNSGDAVAVVLAGAPARVALASTTNMAAASDALDSLSPSDRATDLEGAIRLAQELVKGVPQLDKRVVLLSDFADGSPEDAPLGAEGSVTIWAPLMDLQARADPDAAGDCAVIRADRAGLKVHARIACTRPLQPGALLPIAASASASAPTAASARPPALKGASAGRSLQIRAGDKVIASVPLPPSIRVEQVSADLPADAPEALQAALSPGDAIAEDDEAAVIAAGGTLPIAVVVDIASSRIETGGAPPIEQALAALELDAEVRPLPTVPEQSDALAIFAGLIVDDVPGFTPEVRRSVAAWVERGGVVLLSLGPHAAAAPLGAGFDPLVPGVVRWGPSPAPGIALDEGRSDASRDAPLSQTFGPSATGLARIDPRGRAVLEPEAISGADVLARWKDGAPLLIRRPLGRGIIFALTIPFSTEESDFVLRPAFLALLERFVGTARSRSGTRRMDVGEPWTFEGWKQVSVERALPGGSARRESLAVVEIDGRLRTSPSLAGLYELTLDGERMTRVAAVPEREIDFRPRRVSDAARASTLGGIAPSIDASPYVALALLALLLIELVLRTLSQRKDNADGARTALGP